MFQSLRLNSKHTEHIMDSSGPDLQTFESNLSEIIWAREIG